VQPPSPAPETVTPPATPPPAPISSVAAAPETKSAVTKSKMQSGNYTGTKLGLKPIESPSLPISAEKQARLEALLVKYRADQITPEQYHAERASILAEP
jgi:hypothetical protein